MKIAFFSYEYPKETGGGGIGTYLVQIVNNLPSFGHKVVVFCGTNEAEAWWQSEHVYRIPCKEKQDFNENVVFYFYQLHSEFKFDIIEGSDYSAWGYSVHLAFPTIPYVVRAHSNGYVVNTYLYEPLSGLAKWRFILGAFKRGKWPNLPKAPKPENNPKDEIDCLQHCDGVLSPSHSLGKWYQELGWTKNYHYLPYIFNVAETLLKINQKENNKTVNIIFYGRLEIRKGVLELAKVIPAISQKYPTVHFYFYGKAANSPVNTLDMQAYLVQKLSKYSSQVHFKGVFEPQNLHLVLQEADIVVLPSRYDSFGLAACEAMAAGKPVVGSIHGGMAEIIEHGKSGLVVNPSQINELQRAIESLIQDTKLRQQLGQSARERIKTMLAPEKIIQKQVDIYQQFIRNKQIKN